MLFSAEYGLPVSTQESQIQMLASNLKFHIVYVSTFLLAFGLARLGAFGTFIALGVWFVFLPLGLAIYIVPPELARPLIIARGLFFLSSFVLMALLFFGNPKASAAEA
jgi:heme O synthase-like polyprenyltransferase